MARSQVRFAGSRAPGVSYRPGMGGDFKPSTFGMASSGVKTNAASAADAVSTSAIYGSLRDSAPKYDEIAATAMANRSAERQAATNAEASMAASGIDAAATIEAAEIQADAAKDAANSQKTGSMFGAIGSIATAAIGLSDESTKHTIDQLEDACEVLRELRPVSFFYKEEFTPAPDRMHYGFIAQEYQKVMPDATYYDESIGKLCIDTSELIALLVRANQQLQARVSRLEAKQALAAV